MRVEDGDFNLSADVPPSQLCLGTLGEGSYDTPLRDTEKLTPSQIYDITALFRYAHKSFPCLHVYGPG